MRFANPHLLWLLAIALPLLLGFLRWAWRQRQAAIAQFVQSRLLAQLTVGVSTRRQRLRLALLACSVGLLILALARPQYGLVWEEVRQRGLDIVVALDTSRSMLATDVAPNRLARAKLAAQDLLAVARHDRLGLVAFAGTAFLQCPLTLDDRAFRQSLDHVQAGVIPQGGTALASAIEAALAAFDQPAENDRILILITDGEDHEAGALEAAAKAARAGLRIFTVGVGTPQGDRIRIVDDQGRTTYVTDEIGQPVVSKLDAPLLTELAALTGGDYLPLRGPRPIELLYEARLAPLPKRDLASRLVQQFQERFQWPLGLAFVLLLLEGFIPDRLRPTRPPRPAASRPHPRPRPLAVAQSALLVASLALLLPARASSGRAWKDYQAGRYREAQQHYLQLLEQTPDDPRLHYNAGTAAYDAGDFTQATNSLQAALRSPDPALLRKAYYNLGNARYRLGERAASPLEKLAHWLPALHHYDSALKLEPKDQDAQFNRQWVARRIEELKQQLSPDPEGKLHLPPTNSTASNSTPITQQPPPASPRDHAPPLPTPGPELEPKQPDPPASTPGAESPMPVGQMTPEQARRLLDAARAEERTLVFVPPEDPQRRLRRSRRDW